MRALYFKTKFSRPARVVSLTALCGIVLSALFSFEAVAANAEKDVVGSASDLTLTGSYSPSGTPAPTSDVTFKSGTTYTNAATLTMTKNVDLTMGTLNDLNATAI